MARLSVLFTAGAASHCGCSKSLRVQQAAYRIGPRGLPLGTRCLSLAGSRHAGRMASCQARRLNTSGMASLFWAFLADTATGWSMPTSFAAGQDGRGQLSSSVKFPHWATYLVAGPVARPQSGGDAE